jgi:hypothetical protein
MLNSKCFICLYSYDNYIAYQLCTVIQARAARDLYLGKSHALRVEGGGDL